MIFKAFYIVSYFLCRQSLSGYFHVNNLIGNSPTLFCFQTSWCSCQVIFNYTSDHVGWRKWTKLCIAKHAAQMQGIYIALVTWDGPARNYSLVDAHWESLYISLDCLQSSLSLLFLCATHIRTREPARKEMVLERICNLIFSQSLRVDNPTYPSSILCCSVTVWFGSDSEPGTSAHTDSSTGVPQSLHSISS